MPGLAFIPWLRDRAASGRAVARAALAELKCTLLPVASVFPPYDVFALDKITYQKGILATPGGDDIGIPTIYAQLNRLVSRNL